jgi:DNA polymerase III epsilon subunit-like protein
MHRVLLLDTETTGLPRTQPNGTLIQPRIVTISWLLGIPDAQSERERSYVVRPDGFTIPREATAIHGISTEYARATGSSLQSVLQQLREDCDALHPQIVVAHNASFDLPIVAAEFRRLGISSPLAQLRSICTMRSTIALCRIPRQRGTGFKWPTLQELHVRLFARSFDGAHESAFDLRALFACFSALYRSGYYNADFSLIQTPLMAPSETPPTHGYVFACTDNTVTDCLEKHLFGAPTTWPLSVAPGSVCFLYNFDSQFISGVWRAVQSGTHLDATAWGGEFPYQCRVELVFPRLATLPRWRLAFLAGGRIPNPLPSTRLEQMMRAFRVASDTQAA